MSSIHLSRLFYHSWSLSRTHGSTYKLPRDDTTRNTKSGWAWKRNASVRRNSRWETLREIRLSVELFSSLTQSLSLGVQKLNCACVAVNWIVVKILRPRIIWIRKVSFLSDSFLSAVPHSMIAQSDVLSLVMLSARCFSTVIPILPLATGFDQYFNFAMLRYLAEERLALTSGA